MNNTLSTSQKLNALKSENFNKSVNSAVTAIILFILSYVILVGLAIGLAIICGFAGFMMISMGIHFLTIMVALGIICLGAMVFLFTVKFLFVSNKDTNPHRVQLFEDDHPKLFALIKEIAKETGTSFPQKVFVSHQLNACVFYNSGFWSLFFPIKKNLEIGLGLVSCINEAELKAIIAHEFGHFSQSSMRVGNYVYRVNNIIFSMVNSHDKWDDLLIRWVNTGGLFAWFAVFTSHIANFIRKLLAKAYQPINIRYLALSKEMEFHADLVAANVAGKSASISALRRIEFGAIVFDDLVNKLGELGNEEKRTDNLFINFKEFLRYRAQKNSFQLENDLPIMDDNSYRTNMVHRRVTYNDKWSSHPDLKERVANILKADIEHENLYTDPWNLFDNATSLQLQITTQLYTLGFPDKKLSCNSAG
ncbi:M48 family metallopeptidase [Solitalea canadensis]|uniref:M48 family metallopeptidase n=1 Tax=Solitalea canadensis TaxID=995 RepID=UPI00024738C0|nr:M48 family metallopeptidase [Solitalea canadensis]